MLNLRIVPFWFWLCQVRFKCWDLGGFLDRADFTATRSEHIKLKKYEQEQILKLQTEIKDSALFNALNSKNKKNALNGRWKLDNTWTILAENAGFSKSFFSQQYDFLCSHAHSSRLSVIQVQQTKDVSAQKKIAKASTVILMAILSKFMFDYIHLIPELNYIVDNKEEYAIILFWKNLGEAISR